MRSLLMQIDEALLGFKGATRDRRQQLAPSPDGRDYSLFDQVEGDYKDDAKIVCNGWQVQIAHQGSNDDPLPTSNIGVSQGGASTEYLSGPVAVRLIGHSALSDEEFNRLMDSLWKAHCRQVVEPYHYDKLSTSGAMSGYSGAASTKEVRNLCRAGRYGRAWRHKFPKAQDKFDELISLIDDLCHFPEMGVVFKQPRYVGIEDALQMLRHHLEDLTSSSSGRRTHHSKANTPMTPPPGDFSLI